MAQKQKKKNVAREYEVVYFGDYATKNIGGTGVTLQPLFVKILRTTLVALGGLKVFRQIPNTSAYTTRAGLTQTFFIEDGVPFSRLTGVLKGVTYANQSIINPPIGGNKLILTLDKIVTSAKGEKSYKKVTINLPNTVTVESVGKFVKDRFGDKKLVIAWKYGKVTEILNYEKLEEYKKPRASGGSRKKNDPDLDIPLYMPVGEIKVNESVTLKSGAAGSKRKNTIQTVFAVIRKSSAELMGFSKPTTSTSKEIESGTKISGKEDNAKGDRKVSYSVYKTTKLYSQVWKDSDSNSKTKVSAISDPGTSTTVKLRYTKRLASSSKVTSKSEYAYFQVPSGIPIGMIALFLLNLKSRPRGFQVAKAGGSQYGKSYTLPSKAGSTSRQD